MQGRFVIDDPNLRWLNPLKSSLAEPSKGAGSGEAHDGSTRQRVADLYITLAAGCLKGALFHLNCTCVVAGASSKSPACVFQLHDQRMFCLVHLNWFPELALCAGASFTIDVSL